MSFILDALRKSEHERERRALPALMDRPVAGAAPSRLPLILGGLGVLLLVNFIVLGVILFRSNSPPPPAPAATPVEPARVAPAAPAPPARTRPLEAEATEPDPGASVPVPPPVQHAPGDPSLTQKRPLVARSRTPLEAPAADDARSINDLPEPVAGSLPRVNIDLHVYADDAADRFVIINGVRLREGDTLREGPRLERITPDGVVLSYRGTRFKVPRQQ